MSYSVNYLCALCVDEPVMPMAEVKAHLVTHHGYTDETLKGLTQLGRMFLDGSDFYQNTYDVFDGEKKIAVKTVTGDR